MEKYYPIDPGRRAQHLGFLFLSVFLLLTPQLAIAQENNLELPVVAPSLLLEKSQSENQPEIKSETEDISPQMTPSVATDKDQIPVPVPPSIQHNDALEDQPSIETSTHQTPNEPLELIPKSPVFLLDTPLSDEEKGTLLLPKVEGLSLELIETLDDHPLEKSIFENKMETPPPLPLIKEVPDAKLRIEVNQQESPEEKLIPPPVAEKKAIIKNKFPPIDHFSNQNDFESLIKNRGIQRSDRAASLLLFRAKASLQKGEGEEALRLAHMAEKISPNAPTPQFFLAKATLKQEGWHLVTSVGYYLTGLELIVADFPFLLPALGPFLILAFFAILLMMSFFVLYSLLAYGLTWVHQFSELSRGILQPIPSAFLFALIFLAPLLLGLPLLWFFLTSFVIFWGHYNRIERQIIGVFLIGIACSAWLLPFSLTLFTAKGSPLLDEMSRNYQRDFFWTAPAVQVSDTGWEGLFIQATYASQQQEYRGAKKLYLKALKSKPRSAAILNNLGNLEFYMKDYQSALDYYKKALESEPNLASSHYNMGQAYRELLLFDQGEAQFTLAKAISTQDTEAYASKTERYPDFPVIDEHFSKADLWNILLEERAQTDLFAQRIWTALAGTIPLKASVGIAVFWAIILSVSGILHKKFFSAKQCSFCKKAVCDRCIRRLFSFQICRACEVRYMSIRRKSDYVMIEDAVKRIPFRLYPLFLVPGGGHLAIGKTKTACFYLLLFFLSLLSITIGHLLIPPTDWVLHYAGELLPKLTIVLIYFTVTLSLYRGREGGIWL